MWQRSRPRSVKQYVIAMVCLVIAVAVGYADDDEHPSSQATSAPASAMVRLAGGTFTMGTDVARVEELMAQFNSKRRELFLAELPAHEVTVRPFSIDRTEVTNADFYRGHPNSFPATESDLPVTQITWAAATAHCESIGKRLPTEAEWEFAAGGGRAVEFPWGNQMPSASTANWLGAAIGKPTRVGSYPPNAAGLFDMAGNVWEFVQDDWTSDYSVGATRSVDRKVIRGGSFGGSPVNLRVRYRDSHPANGPGPHVGFRCARS
jgi:formylglycine-generating enzyme required for sulfatase activity